MLIVEQVLSSRVFDSLVSLYLYQEKLKKEVLPHLSLH